tara:strand:+ start:112466 stop:113002 length:537 start_codon:yes stop_codon:yes gene_type:complete
MKQEKYGRTVFVEQPLAQSGTPNQIPDGQPVEVWHDDLGRQVDAAHDITQGVEQIIDVAPAISNFLKTEHTALTAPGDTPSTEVSDHEFITYQVDVSAIDTNITGSIEQSVDNALFFTSKLENDNVNDMTISSNKAIISATGSYGLTSRRQGQYSRFNFLGEVGGTSAVATISILAGR